MSIKFPSDKAAMQEAFDRVAEEYPVSYVPQMKEAVSGALARLKESGDEFIGPNLTLATQLNDRCMILLDRYERFSPEQRALAVGAIRYFILSMDGTKDSEPITGLDDDVFVMNLVLAKLNLEQHQIELPS